LPTTILSREGLSGQIADFVAAMLFFVTVFVCALLRSQMAALAALPPVLMAAGLLVLLWRHFSEGRPRIFWGHYDAAVVFLFVYVAANVYYSEIISVTWRAASLYLLAFAGFFFGRLLFYRRLLWYAAGLVITLILAFIWVWMLRQRLMMAARPDMFYADRLLVTLHVLAVFLAFWLVTLPFMIVHRPTNLIALIYVAVLVGGYTFYLIGQLGWLFEGTWTAAAVTSRHERLQIVHTVADIARHYPLTGGGLGTFPNLFEAYRPSPRVPFGAAFNSYLFLLAEAGLAGLLLYLYPLVMFSVYIIRHWGFFLNRKLRMGVLALLSLTILCLIQGLHDPHMHSVLAWLLLFTAFGTLSSLVNIRDPMRIFPQASSVAGLASRAPADGAERPFKPGLIRRMGFGGTVELAAYAVLVLVVLAAQVAPHVAASQIRRRPQEEATSPSYGLRLERTVRVFPFLPEAWVRLANYYQDSAKDSNDLVLRLLPKIEEAYQRAIRLDPFEPRTYERLALLYASTNSPMKAREALARGVRANPNDLVLRLMLVRELQKAGSLALATWHMQQALHRIAPAQAELYLQLAELYEQRGLTAVAVRHYQYARQVLPESALSSPQARRLRQRLGLPEVAQTRATL
jgi:hypothetical protein